MQYHTTAAYVSGAICGHIWQPGFDTCGIPHTFDLRGRIARFADSRGCTFRDIRFHAPISLALATGKRGDIYETL